MSRSSSAGTRRSAPERKTWRARIGAPDRTLAVACDVRKRDDIQRLLQATITRFQRVDIWINNAGHGLLDSVEKMKAVDYRPLFDTNLFGAIEGMQVAIAQMRKQGSGTIINISSVAGHIAVPFMAAYSASKAALNAVGRAAGLELRNTGVRVMTVCPGYIATPMMDRFTGGTAEGRAKVISEEPIGRMGAPEEIADAVVWLCSESAGFPPCWGTRSC